MANFASQVSNLSALTSALGAFSRILEASEGFDNDFLGNEELNHESAQSFLNSQRTRISEIERQVFQSTEHIHSSKAEAKSVAELADLCRIVQESNRRQMEQLRLIMEAAGCEVPWDDAWKTEQPRIEMKKPEWTLVGCPLERVSEGDTETEGSATPRSTLGNSPFHRQSSSKKNSLTSPAPKMDRFSFSNGANSVVQNKTSITEESVGDDGSDDSVEGLNYSSRSDARPNFDDAFREEDDMITIDTQSTLAGLSFQSIQRQADAIFKEADQAEWRMQRTLQQVEESILESRPSDEASSAVDRSVETSFEARSSVKYDREDDDDDSTNMVPTVVAEERGIKSRNMQHTGDEDSYKDNGIFNKKTAISSRPTHVVVDSSAPSPSHTLLTMDGTMMNDTWLNETMASLSVLGDDDVSSTMTPILDRYRLDPDDGSLGIKVVPNKRGHHKKNSLRNSRGSFDIQDAKNVLPTVYSGQKTVPSTPMSLPGSVSARKNKKFRKTPHPHKKERDYGYSEEENGNPNILHSMYPKPRHSSEDKKESPFSSIFVPPLRARSLELRHALPVTPQGNTRARSLQPKSQPFTPSGSSRQYNSRTPSGSASRPTTDKLRDGDFRNAQSEPRRLTRDFHATGSMQAGKWIEKITMAEYQVAPLVVRQQVSRDEVNEAAGVLDNFLTSNLSADQRTLEFTEKQAYEVLSNYLSSDQKSKSVLMSLCHWRRLLMYRDAIHGMRFVVNQFEQ